MNDKPNFPGWGVNRVKVDLESSEETLCFRAGVTLDGKLVGHAFNEGGSGPTHVTLTEAALKNTAKPAGIADHVDRLVDNVVALKELAKTHKRWCKEIGVGCVYALQHDELKSWEAGMDHQESTMPPFRAYSSHEAAAKALAGVEHFSYAKGSSKALWEIMVQCHDKWTALEDARTDKMRADYEAKLQAQLSKAQEGKTSGPEENEDYFRKKPSAEEAHRVEIGKILQRHLAANLPLPATVRLEALKLLSEACVIIDDEDLSTAALLEYYVQYVVPEIPLMPNEGTDELGPNQ